MNKCVKNNFLVDLLFQICVSPSFPSVWCGAFDPALWAGSLGYPAGGHRLHRGGDDAIWSTAGTLGLQVYMGSNPNWTRVHVNQDTLPCRYDYCNATSLICVSLSLILTTHHIHMNTHSYTHAHIHVYAHTHTHTHPQYHINKLSLSEPQGQTSSPAMDDLDSALQCLEVKMDGDSSASDMLVSHIWSAFQWMKMYSGVVNIP